MAHNVLAPYQQRLAQFQRHLNTHEVALISKPNDIFYFTGFPQLAPAEREAFLVVFPQEAVLFHHSFSPVSTDQQWLKSIPTTELKTLTDRLKDAQTKKVLIDQDTLSVAEYKELKRYISCEVIALDKRRVWQQREIKDQNELQKITRAGKIAAAVMTTTIRQLKAGITERETANLAASLLWEHQASGPSFPIIVAFGAHGALPHHQPTDTKLKNNTPVLIDLGAYYEGYCSDMTRSFWFGKQPTPLFGEVERIVRAAYDQAVSTLQHRHPKLTAKDVDDAARTVITSQNYGDHFIHTTGHGLGIEIHEPPSLSWQDTTEIKPGMAVTIEPGIYLSSKFGYRHEDTFFVTQKGATILTKDA